MHNSVFETKRKTILNVKHIKTRNKIFVTKVQQTTKLWFESLIVNLTMKNKTIPAVFWCLKFIKKHS